MATRLRTVLKLGNFEVKRRVELAVKSKAKTIPAARGPVAGVSGNAPNFGSMTTGEYLQKLEGPKGRAIYDEMRRSDPQVQSTLKAITLPIRQANYYIEPGSEDNADVEIAETIEKNLLEGMTITWDDTIRHALLMLPMGFSILEKIWEIRDNMLYLRKLDPRLPLSISEWEYDAKKKRTTAVIQRDSNFDKYTLPIEKLLIFSNDKEGDNWEGISILRAAYKPWYIKNTLEKINAIKHERYGVGVPVGTLPKGIVEGTAQWDAMQKALEDLYANEKSFLMMPEGYAVELLGGGSAEMKGTDALPSIKYYDEEIAKAALAMFINLGTTETGSRALGGSFIEVFLLSLQSCADYICEVINRFLVHEYVNANWGEVENYPRLKVEQIKKLDPLTLAKLAEVGIITKDLVIENAARDLLHLPQKEEEEEEEEEQPPPVKKEEPEIEEEETEQDEEVEPVAAHEHRQGYKFIDREMTIEELMVDVPSIEMRLNEAQRSLEDQILEMKKKQSDYIIVQLMGGRKIWQIKIILRGEMHDALLREFENQIRLGKEEAESEVKAQLLGRKLADPGQYDYQDYLDMFEDDLAIKIEGASNKLAATLAASALDLKRQGFMGEDLRQRLQEKAQEKISDRTWTTLVAGAVNKGWGEGRDLAFKQYVDEEDYSYYSAILDGRACPNCLAKDGHHHKYGDPEYITPSPECDGGDSCRCMTIMVMKSESAAEEEYERRAIA